MKVKLIEPISRKLLVLGRAYLGVLGAHMEHLDMNRFYYALTVICFYDGELTQKALAEKLGKDKSIIVTVIDTLTEKGFVYREVNPADRRQHLLRVTEKAKKAVPQIIEAFELMNSSAAHDISDHDMEIFESVLHKMKNNLSQFSIKQTNTTLSNN
ncbi:MarR family transcriptional regulator [Mucilaginibacter sp.]|uniref:MarR family winged helix-turn-helix transcriptional regulator n=1 Tax=Mucilaginibacter sp. TaxID=1882438 RepID=UPI00263A1FC2|nr:MarR family transcriptional regulator [Mucilaginibacter sp.]